MVLSKMRGAWLSFVDNSIALLKGNSDYKCPSAFRVQLDGSQMFSRDRQAVPRASFTRLATLLQGSSFLDIRSPKFLLSLVALSRESGSYGLVLFESMPMKTGSQQLKLKIES